MKSMKNNNHHKHRRPLQLPLLLLLLLLLPLSESAQRARRGWWARGGLPVVVEGEEPPEGEVEDMIASTLRRQLPGCHKVIVSDRHPVRNEMKALGEEVFVWEMQPLLASLPPSRPLVRTTHRQGGAAPLCVAFVILAPLQVVAAAMEGLQREEWFQGARKLVFAYTGFANTSLEAAVERHATLRSPQLHVATSDFFPSEIGWAMTPGCPFRDKFNHQIRRLLEAGLLTRWLNQLIHDPGRREAQESEEPQQAERFQQPLILDHEQGAYYVLFIGYALSGPLFLLELVCFSRYHLS
ncbi:uncharacterized protein LOC135090001 isoform X2 [Scylla paramamosain]|uniref:uncharacterized protein LOC135090001 isoform X2 n=1 Tax=Scylla paramamosain TaxID=85552 RepID=UPI0030833FB0